MQQPLETGPALREVPDHIFDAAKQHAKTYGFGVSAGKPTLDAERPGVWIFPLKIRAQEEVDDVEHAGEIHVSPDGTILHATSKEDLQANAARMRNAMGPVHAYFLSEIPR